MKFLLTVTLLLAAFIRAHAADGTDQVKGYLIQKGLNPNLTSTRGSPVKVMETKDGSIKHLVWDSTRLGLPKPELTQLPTVAEAQALILEHQQTHEEPDIVKPDVVKPDVVKPDVVKPDELKLAEANVIQYLRAESVISTNATTVTQAQLVTWVDSWETMPPSKARDTLLTYLRLMIPVLVYGGDFATVELKP